MPWSEWEDWRAGLYRPETDDGRQVASMELLSDADRFREVSVEMLREWVHAARHNLAHMWSGRNAWLGQATCCYAHGATGADTRAAWGLLSNGEQRAANEVARLVREAWERDRRDAQTVFEF